VITDEEIGRKYDFEQMQIKASFIRNASKVLGNGWLYDSDIKKIKQVYNGFEWKVPWVYIKRVPDINCNRHSGILFGCFEIVPRYCMNCYKVVIRPRTIVELFKLHDTMRDFFPEWIKGKCGVEERGYVNARYGGYCYTQGLEEGQKTYEEVRKQVSEHISPDVPVMLKRACTEYKEMYGESDKWDEIKETKTTGYPREMWDMVEDWVDETFIFQDGNPPQPDSIKWGVMEHWMDFAYASGDASYRIFTKGKNKYVNDSTYERVEK